MPAMGSSDACPDARPPNCRLRFPLELDLRHRLAAEYNCAVTLRPTRSHAPAQTFRPASRCIAPNSFGINRFHSRIRAFTAAVRLYDSANPCRISRLAARTQPLENRAGGWPTRIALVEFALERYSARSASTAFTRAARSAGTADAMTAAARMRTAAAIVVRAPGCCTSP